MSSTKYIRNWFSNMKPFDEPLVVDGISYLTVENFYQAMKLDPKNRDLIKEIAMMGAFESKKAFRGNHKYIRRQDWTLNMGLYYMDIALRHKFKKGTSWHIKLMETGDDEIIEWNNWGDKTWGVCVDTKVGDNYLGKLLMTIREEYKKL